MTAESMLSKRLVLRFTCALFFLKHKINVNILAIIAGLCSNTFQYDVIDGFSCVQYDDVFCFKYVLLILFLLSRATFERNKCSPLAIVLLDSKMKDLRKLLKKQNHSSLRSTSESDFTKE